MKEKVIGILFSENHLKTVEKLFLKNAKKKGIRLVMINTSKDIDERTLEKKICDIELFYNTSAEDFAVEYVKTLESFGKRVIDSSRAYYTAEDKWLFFLICKKNGILTPETRLLCENIIIARNELKKFNQWPVILKRVCGTMGEFVERADSLAEAEEIIKKFWKKGSERAPIIAQEFIESPSYRITAIDGKVVQTAIKNGHGWKSTGVYGNHFEKFDTNWKLRRLVKKITRVTGIKVCGIDFLKNGDKWYALEVNAEPAFDFFEEEREKLICETLDYLATQTGIKSKEENEIQKFIKGKVA